MYDISKQNEKIDITGKVNSCDYLPAMKEYIINMIVQILDFPKKTVKPRYFVQTKNQEKIIMIWYPMSVPYMQKNFTVPIIIFLPKQIPNLPPQIVLEVKQGFSINYKNRNILPNSATIMTQTLHNWSMYSSIDNVMNEIFQSFSAIFPVYKPSANASNNNQSINYNNYNNNNFNNNSMNNNSKNNNNFNNNYAKNNINQYNPYNSAMQNSSYQQMPNNNYTGNNINNNENNNNMSRSMMDNIPINLGQAFKGDNIIVKNKSITPNIIEPEKLIKKDEKEVCLNKEETGKANEEIKPEEKTEEKTEQEIYLEKENEIEKLKEEINEYKKRIAELENKLSETEKLNESLLKKLNEEILLKEILKKTISEKDNSISEYNGKIKSLEEQIREFNEKINIMNTQEEKAFEKNNSKVEASYNDKEEEKPFAINFMSMDQRIHYPLLCKNSDLISRLEEELYNEYEEFKEYNTFLTVNGNIVKRFKTVAENKIKKGDAILVNIGE